MFPRIFGYYTYNNIELKLYGSLMVLCAAVQTVAVRGAMYFVHKKLSRLIEEAMASRWKEGALCRRSHYSTVQRNE
jgi:hypothetical protein